MKWKKGTVDGVIGIDVPAYRLERPRWWELMALLTWLIEYLRSGVHVRVLMSEAVAAKGYRIGFRVENGKTLLSAKLLHHREFLFVVEGKAGKLFALDAQGGEVEIVSARRSSSFEPNHATLPVV